MRVFNQKREHILKRQSTKGFQISRLNTTIIEFMNRQHSNKKNGNYDDSIFDIVKNMGANRSISGILNITGETSKSLAGTDHLDVNKIVNEENEQLNGMEEMMTTEFVEEEGLDKDESSEDMYFDIDPDLETKRDENDEGNTKQ